jgi:hypothetical protein
MEPVCWASVTFTYVETTNKKHVANTRNVQGLDQIVFLGIRFSALTYPVPE